MAGWARPQSAEGTAQSTHSRRDHVRATTRKQGVLPLGTQVVDGAYGQCEPRVFTFISEKAPFVQSGVISPAKKKTNDQPIGVCARM